MFLRKTLFAVALTASAMNAAGSVFAAEPASETEIKALRERLHQSDAAIDRLSRRLEELEHRRAQEPIAAERTKQERSAAELSSDAFKPASFFDDLSADKASVEKRLDAIEKSWKKQEDTNKKFSDADKKSVVLGTSGVTAKLSGRLHMDYWTFPEADAGAINFEGEDPDDRFHVRRARITVDGDITDNMLYKIEMDFANANSPVFKDLYIGFKELPFLQQVLIGNQKRPYGMDAMNSSRFTLFLERPLVVDLINEDQRRFGVQSWGSSEDESWNWRYGVFNLESFQDDGTYEGDNYQLEVAGRLARTYWYDETSDGRGYGHVGISGSYAQPDGNAPSAGSPRNEAQFRARPEARTTSRWIDTGVIATTEHYEVLGLETVFNAGEFQVGGEWMELWLQRDVGSNLNFNGGYAYVSYFLTGEHTPWERKTGTLGRVKPFENFFMVNRCDGGTGSGWGAWQALLRYSYADFSNDDVQGGVGEHLTLGLNWYWNANAKVMLNYTPFAEIRDHAPDATPIAPAQTSAEYQIIGARFAIDY
jgi:phosphate-selective porin OprO and OprP